MDPSLKIPLIASQEKHLEDIKPPNPLEKANFFKRLLFLWVYPILKLGNNVYLEQNMLYDLRKTDNSLYDYKSFEKIWDANKSKTHPLIRSLYNAFKRSMAFCSFLAFFVCILMFSTPIMINILINYVKNPDKRWEDGLKLLIIILVLKLVYSFFSTHQSFYFNYLGVRLENVINMALYQKSLKYSLVNSKIYNVGELVNYMQVDANKLRDLPLFLGGVIFLPLQIAIAIFIMYEVIGVSFIAGIGAMVLTFIFNLAISKYFTVFQKKILTAKDNRMKLANEIISAIKMIKVNAWESFFLGKISEARDIELSWLAKSLVISVLMIFSLYMTPMLILSATFAMYTLTDHVMDAENIFTLVSTFVVVQNTIRLLPLAIAFMIQALVSIKRIQGFLLAEEIKLDYIKSDVFDNEEMGNKAILLKNGYFFWDQEKKQEDANLKNKDKIEENGIRNFSIDVKNINDKPEANNLGYSYISTGSHANSKYTLKNLNLEVKKGSITSIIGDVGSGKSSFLHALIGDMKYDEDMKPELCIQGNMCYVPQKPWILNGTVKDNILFNSAYDETRYNDCIKYSCLERDLTILSNGDQTMIGEKGVNLSGGQKSRINLARAIYSNKDIVLLDDPLSAVDVHVGKYLMKECFLKYLKGKTIVLITHALYYLKYTDYIYVIEDGQSILNGTYEDLMLINQFHELLNKLKKNNSHEKPVSIIENEAALDKNDTTITNNSALLNGESIFEEIKEKFINKVKTSENENANIINYSIVPTNDSQQGKSINIYDNIILEEDRKKGSVSAEIYSLYLRMNGGSLFAIIVLIIMSFWLANQLGTNLWLAHWTSSNDDQNHLFYLEIYLILALVYGFFSLARAAILCYSNLKVSRKLHYFIMRSLLFAPLNEFFERVPAGRILNRISKDINVVDGDIPFSIGNFLVPAFNFIGDLIFCIYSTSFYMVIPIVLFFLICFYIQKKYMNVNRELIRLESISRSPIVSYFNESLTGLSSIRAYKQEKSFYEKHAYNMNENKKNLMIQTGLNQWFTLMLTFISFFVNMAAISFCVFLNTTSPSLAGLLLSYSLALDSDINGTVNCYSALEAKMISFERCKTYSEIKPENGYERHPPQINLSYEKKLNKTAKKFEAFDDLKDWPSEGKIRFESVFIKYRDPLDFALRDINLTICPTEKIGVVGRTGAGKSTIINALVRILEASHGKITIDDINIFDVPLDILRGKITTILQDASLFSGTLRYNLDPLNQFNDDLIWDILEKVCLKESFTNKNGLESLISENGGNLSAGEKQLICIGRAILRKNRIILIDEATANIDIKTESTIYKVIREQLKECTVITIAHRLNTIMSSDKILVINNGQIVEFDKPEILEKNPNSFFHSLWKEALQENILH